MSTALVKRTHYMTFELRNVALYGYFAGVAKIAADQLWKRNNLDWIDYAYVETEARKRLSFWLVRWLTSKGIKQELLAKFGAKA